MKVKSFTVFEEYYELITLLDEEEQKNLLLAIFKFMFEDIEPTLNSRENKVFNNLKRPLIISKNKSNSKQNKIKIKSNENQIEIKSKSKKDETTSVVTKSMSMSMSNNKFIKPKLEEIKEYCLERKNGIDAESFYNFYESKGWKVGNQPMKNWKACIITWEKRQGKKIEETPEWFDKDLKNEELTKEESEQLDDLLESALKKIESIGDSYES